MCGAVRRPSAPSGVFRCLGRRAAARVSAVCHGSMYYDTLCRSAVWMQNGVSEYTTAAVRIRIRGVERRITAAIGGEVGMRTCSPRRLDEMSNRQGRHP